MLDDELFERRVENRVHNKDIVVVALASFDVHYPLVENRPDVLRLVFKYHPHFFKLFSGYFEGGIQILGNDNKLVDEPDDQAGLVGWQLFDMYFCDKILEKGRRNVYLPPIFVAIDVDLDKDVHVKLKMLLLLSYIIKQKVDGLTLTGVGYDLGVSLEQHVATL